MELVLPAHRLLFGAVFATLAAAVAISNQKDLQKDAVLTTLFSAGGVAKLLLLGLIVVMTTVEAKTSLLIKCQIYARCCGQTSHRPWHSSSTALRPLLSSPQMVSSCPTHAHRALGVPRDLCLPREALGFPILTLSPETRDPGQLAAMPPFLGKAFCM